MIPRSRIYNLLSVVLVRKNSEAILSKSFKFDFGKPEIELLGKGGDSDLDQLPLPLPPSKNKEGRGMTFMVQALMGVTVQKNSDSPKNWPAKMGCSIFQPQLWS